MAEISKDRWAQYKRLVLEILNQNPGGLYWKDLFAELEIRLPATDFENGNYESNGQRRRNYIVRWGTISLVKAGWLIKDNGFWTITDSGKQALIDFPTADQIYNQAKILYDEWKSGREVGQDDQVEDGEIELLTSLEEAVDSASGIIYQYLATMDPYRFQDLIAGLLKGMGYYVSWVSPPGRDGGMDIVAFQDPLGATGKRIKVQVKRRADKAGAESLRSFLGILSDDDIGLYVCTGGFSPEAERITREQEKKRLTLLDSGGLVDLWVKHYHQLPQASREILPLRPIYHLNLPS